MNARRGYFGPFAASAYNAGMHPRAESTGQVILAGAGPGGPELLTVAAASWLRQADVVVYDRLVSPTALALCPEDAERRYVGKTPGGQGPTQEQINALLIAEARLGRLVVRLKGGDPLIFGRGGEEASALAEAGVPFRILPGVTAAGGAAAFAGIPLTDRRFASAVAMATGSEDPSKEESRLDWDALAKLDTLVVYMGVRNQRAIVDRLIRAGRSRQTPAAVVQQAATPRQRTVVGALADIADRCEQAAIRAPALLIVGGVTTLRGRLAWYERLPLFGRRVLLTRAAHQNPPLAERLRQYGAEPVEAPALEIQPAPEPEAVADALGRLGEFHWVVLTSPNGVAALGDHLERLGLDARALGGVSIAAVGPGTAEALRQRFLRADLVPETYTTGALGEALAARDLHGRRALLLRSDQASEELAQILHRAGAELAEVPIYRTARPAALPDAALDALRRRAVDWITFASSSAVRNLFALVRQAGADCGGARAAAIGPVTAKTLSAHGVEAAVMAYPHTIEAMVEAMARYQRAEASPASDSPR